MAVSHDDFRDVLLASSPDTCRGKSAWITIALKSGRRRRASSKSRPILVYVIGPGDDARALGCLQHVAGLARQVGFAPLRPLRDLSIDRYTPFLAQMKNVLASADLGSRALAYLQLVSRTCR